MKRTKILKLNIITSLVPWTVLAIIGFIKIKFFINIFGSELNGLIQLLSQIYSYISIVELGFGSAILFSLYKPLADKDETKVARLFNGSKKMYLRIATVMIIGGLIAGIVSPLLIKNINFPYMYVFGIFAIFGVDYFMKYIFYLPYRTLLGADQKGYKANIIVNTTTIIVKLIEILLIMTKINYMYILAIIIPLNCIGYYILMSFVNREYPYLRKEKGIDSSPAAMTKDVMVHKVSKIIFYGTDSVILSIFSGLTTVSIYGAYNYIIQSVLRIISLILSSPLELFGNLFAKEADNEEKHKKLYNEFVSMTYFTGLVICSILFIAMNKFIGIWINSSYEVTLWISMLFCLCLWYECTEKTNTTLIESKGKFKETKHIQILGALTNIIVSVTGTIYFSRLGDSLEKPALGILGVLLGTTLSYALVRQPLQNRYICKNLIKQSYFKRASIFAMFTVILLAIFGLNIEITSLLSLYKSNNIMFWLRDTAIISTINISLIFGCMYLSYKSFRDVLARFLKRS